jgi:transposase
MCGAIAGGAVGGRVGGIQIMIPMPIGTQIWVACGATDMRKGFDGLAMLVQEVIKKNPYAGTHFCFPRQAR